MDRAKFEAFIKQPQELKTVEVDGLGTVYLRRMTTTERDLWETTCAQMREDNNFAFFRSRLLVVTLADEKGERLLKDDDIHMVAKMDGHIASMLWDEARKHNRLTKEDTDELAANLKKGQSVDSGSN